MIISLLSACTIVFAGCGQTDKSQEISQDILSSTSTTMCANAVQDYLSKADTKGKSGKQVKK